MLNLKTIALGAVIALGAGAASAATTYSPCAGDGFDISGYVSGATDCEISSADQDFLNTNPITVNEGGGFFDIDDWSFVGKIGVGNMWGDGEGQSGSYDITSLFSGLTGSVMLVFKDGAGTTLVGYLLDMASLSGTWESPFVCPPFSGQGNSCGPEKAKDVSHISVYSTVAPIPLPAAGFLMLGALGALGVAARRRKA